MKQATGKGETIEQAIDQALKQLQLSKEKVEIEIVDEGKKSFLGLFGGRLAEVRVTEKEQPIDPIEKAATYLAEVVTHMGINVKVDRQVNGKEVTFALSGEDVALVIGKRGATLNSLQVLTQLVANRYAMDYLSIVVDAEGYRKKRQEILERLAKKTARDVKYSRKKIMMEPMPAFERKIVHQVLSEYSYIKTESQGQEPHRSIVVSMK